MRMINKKNTFL